MYKIDAHNISGVSSEVVILTEKMLRPIMLKCSFDLRTDFCMEAISLINIHVNNKKT